jgi:hypothetical protein
MTPSIPIFRNEINALGNFREGGQYCKRIYMLGLPATVQMRAFIVIFDKEYTLPVASACGALMEMCFMLSVIAVKRN